ncbi:MAG: hypothetical protein R3F17_07720 [Planctomycetota bacterium]
MKPRLDQVVGVAQLDRLAREHISTGELQHAGDRIALHDCRRRVRFRRLRRHGLAFFVGL